VSISPKAASSAQETKWVSHGGDTDSRLQSMFDQVDLSKNFYFS
jgi:hypothetical protein